MADFEDYYEILQVHSLAEPEVIKKAFTALAYKYHPDRNPSADAAIKMKKINIAYAILSDTHKRKIYDAEWIRNKQPARPQEDKPRPAVEPRTIEFIDVKPGEIQRSSFLILNAGGSYKKIWFSNPNSWVKVANYYSLTDTDELPLKVEIEATGEERDRNYVEFIKVRLDDEETQLRVELATQKKPATKPKPVEKKETAGRRNAIWIKLTAGLAIIAIAMIALMRLPPIETGVQAPAAAVPPAAASAPTATAPELILTPSQPAAQLQFQQLDLSPIADFDTVIDPFPVGAQTFNGVYFTLSKSIMMTRCNSAYLPNEVILTLDVVHPKDVFILINTIAAKNEFMDEQAGKITLEFDSGATQETELFMGQNIREYSMNDTATIRTVYDTSNQLAWQGGTNGRFAIDMLTIPIAWRNQVSTLKQITITDTSETTTDSIDPGLIVWGLTISHSE